jgi:chromosome segregation ATPase
MKYESRIDSLEFQVNKIVENTSKYNGELPHIKERLNSHNECFRLYEGRIQKIEKDIKSLKNMQNNYDLV